MGNSLEQYKLVVGRHTVHLLKSQGVSRMLQAKLLAVYATFVLLRCDLLTSTETCDTLFRTNQNESSLSYTGIFVSFLYQLP